MAMIPALLIKSTQPGGHFRAGRHHPPEEKAWEAAGFTPAELEALQGDPRLIVIEGELDVPEILKPIPRLDNVPAPVCPVADLRVSHPFPEAAQDAATAAAPEGSAPPAPAKAKTATKAKKAKA